MTKLEKLVTDIRYVADLLVAGDISAETAQVDLYRIAEELQGEVNAQISN